ncbi:CRISPR-associated helicase Cas3' [Bifidobacterium adolescentis]|uniref:CRISPR-associated helicase Cas3' n=1 Tax=Bifidobacterium adolescentis TaxID=1680 RepID=UPI003BB721F2
MVLLARKDEEGNTQALYDHLHGAGRLASGFEDEFADISRTAAVLHDVGKVAQQFQTYLLSDDGHRGDVQHARQGAFVVNDFFESKGEIEEIAKEILELAISKHHGGLPDCIDESGNRAFLLGFTESDKSNEKYAYQEIKRGLNGLALDLQSNFRGSAEDIACFLKKIKSLRLSKDSIYFYLGLLVKLIYSRLVDADRTDAACFETRKQYRPNAVDWQNLISRLDKSMRSFDSSSEINRIRHQINEQCCLAGARETGIYRLSIPTGGGKTLASLNFALHHALKTGKRRIIYVIPYLSITTQTAKTFRDVLGLNSDSDVLLEHYSTAGMQRSADVADNASSEFEDAGEHQRKLAAERWDNPIIVTTMVEFLETVMSARGTKLRKFHNMADSVIIFDEIQSLPMNTINLFNEIVSFLSKITNSTILLCSATQPLLEKTKRENLLLSEKPDLIAETESYEDKLRRTRIVASAENKSCDELGQIIYQQARKNGNCLAIVNLKKEAREIFQCLERLDVNHEFELIHLSTAMCGRHRTDCLNRIGALLDPGNPKPVICVSTQLIEAGVDISFACVVRAMAGLDSIMQAAGRCNRNGESVEPKNVYVYPLKDEDSMERYLPDIAMGKQLTLQIEVDDVMALFKEGDFEDNKALSPMFLLGYSCQRRASRRKAQEISQKNNSNN